MVPGVGKDFQLLILAWSSGQRPSVPQQREIEVSKDGQKIDHQILLICYVTK